MSETDPILRQDGNAFVMTFMTDCIEGGWTAADLFGGPPAEPDLPPAANRPLADRLRPATLDQVVGQALATFKRIQDTLPAAARETVSAAAE